jgi:hypothetical protein
MNRLTREAFERAREFMHTQARDVERELFLLHFENGSAELVRAALAAYQNPDGGFGHGLEPDVRTPSSSALATGISLSILKELAVPAQDEIVRRAVDYLLESYDGSSGVWRVVPEDTNQYPHAPWWHDEDGSLARTFDEFTIIPRVMLVGLLNHYHPIVPADWLEPVTADTVQDVLAAEPLGTGGGSDIEYAISLAKTEALPRNHRARLVEKIRDSAPEAVVRDPEKWDTYCITPLTLAPRPDSLAADLMGEDLQRNLDYLIESQKPGGYWDPTWSWGGFYPQVWEQARQDWRGHLTLEKLESLQAFGRIEVGGGIGTPSRQL